MFLYRNAGIIEVEQKVNTTPIFILGNQKSGTTAIASLLSTATSMSLTPDFVSTIGHPTLQLELNFNLISFNEFIKKYCGEFSNEIIKEPFLTFYINDLLKAFPAAKFVFIVRDPFQNIRSILNRLKIPGNLDDIDLFDWDELNKVPVWRLALQSEMLGINSANYIEAMANRWNYAVESYLHNKDKFILVKYEDFVQDKNSFISDLASQLGLKIQGDISSLINVQFQPKGDCNVDLNMFFGEKNYQTIQKTCSGNIKKLEYQIS